jgi:hypothetical protein
MQAILEVPFDPMFQREMLDIQHFFLEFGSNLICGNPMRLWHTSQNDRSHGIVTHQAVTKF